MLRRSRAREVVLQILYRLDLNPDRDSLADEAFLRKRLHDNDELVSFARSLLQGVLRNREELDEMLAGCAENWSLDRMAVTDRNADGAARVDPALPCRVRDGRHLDPSLLFLLFDRRRRRPL